MKTYIFPVIIGICILALGLGMNACQSKGSVKSDKDKVVDTDYANNSKNSVDWVGTYIGTVPCADCTGIYTQVTLKNDNTYSLQVKYLGKDDSTQLFEGTFQWNDVGNIIILSGLNEKSMPSSYLVGENKLIQMGMDGKVINGELVSNYILTKIDENLIDKKWKLFELAGVTISTMNPQPAIEPFITFTKENKVNGNSGCNGFLGSYVLASKKQLHFSGMASTRKMCLDMTIEDQMNKLFQIVDSYTIQNDTLSLKEDEIVLARFVAE